MNKQEEKGESPDTIPLRTAPARRVLCESGKMSGGPTRARYPGKMTRMMGTEPGHRDHLLWTCWENPKVAHCSLLPWTCLNDNKGDTFQLTKYFYICYLSQFS